MSNSKSSNEDIGYVEGKNVRNNVISYLAQHVKERPKQASLRWTEPRALAQWDGSLQADLATHEVNFAELDALIAGTAVGLTEAGIREGDRVILFLPMSLGMYTAMFAIQRIGAIAVFLDSWARRNHLGASAACVKPSAMISHRAAFDLIADVPEFADMSIRIIAGPGADDSFSARLEDLMKPGQRDELIPVSGSDTALVTFTTGSSGNPKGANRTHQFLSAQHRALRQVIPYTDADIDLPAFPIFSLNNIASGVTTLLPAINLAEPSERDAVSLVRQIQKEGVTCATLSPSMLNGISRYCLDASQKLPSLRRVVTGGAPVSRDNVRDFASIAPNAEVWVLYGSTEVEPMAHIEGKDMLAQKTNDDPEIVEEGVNVGQIVDELDAKFIRIQHGPVRVEETPWHELEVAKGEVGELIVTGGHVCRDYYNNEEAFARAKIRDTDNRVWHRTGDLGYVDQAGYLWIVGRVHSAIDRGGRYYFPVRAEVILNRCNGIRQGAFLGLEDPQLGQRNTVVVQLDKNSEIDEQSALAEVQRLFQKNEIPIDGFYCVDTIPMDPRHHSKVEYEILRTQLNDESVRDLLAGA